jgi:hypothetical protein
MDAVSQLAAIELSERGQSGDGKRQ